MQAVEIAKASRSGVIVVDKIEVKPPLASRSDYTEDMARTTREKAKVLGDKVGTKLEDAWLYTKIMAKLVSDSNTPARRINVDVENSVVTLRGDVDSPAVRDEAERIARETDGVKRVINRLKVNAG
jgi:osmotically-inducible protein OsmY